MGRNVTDHIICYKMGTCHKEMASVLFALTCFVKNFTEGNDMNKIWGEIKESDKGRQKKTNGAGIVKSERRTQKVLREGTKIKEILEANWKEAKGRSRLPPKCTDLPVRHDRSWDRTLTGTGTLTSADIFQQEGWEKEGRKSFQKQNSHYKNLHFPVFSPSLSYTDQLLGSRKSHF